jgi:hypothetical protein
MVQVMLVAGDYVAEVVWFRVVQVVTNSEVAIHEYAAEKLLATAQSKWSLSHFFLPFFFSSLLFLLLQLSVFLLPYLSSIAPTITSPLLILLPPLTLH